MQSRYEIFCFRNACSLLETLKLKSGCKTASFIKSKKETERERDKKETENILLSQDFDEIVWPNFNSKGSTLCHNTRAVPSREYIQTFVSSQTNSPTNTFQDNVCPIPKLQFPPISLRVSPNIKLIFFLHKNRYDSGQQLRHTSGFK